MSAPQKSLRWLLLLVNLSSMAVGSDQALAEAIRDKSAWFTFESSTNTTVESVGLTPWPAYIFNAQIGDGKYGKGLIMGGKQNNGLLLPNPATFFGNEAQAGTIAFWVQAGFAPNNEEKQRVIIDLCMESMCSAIDAHQIVILTEGNRLGAQAAGMGGGARMYIPTPIASDHWVHIALAWDANSGSALYVDGKKVSEAKGQFRPTPLGQWPGRLGAHTPFGGYPFKGSIDELRLFNRRLGEEEIRQLLEPSTSAQVKVLDWNEEGIRVANNGLKPIALWLRTWRPETGAKDFDCQAPLPVPIAATFTGGATGVVEKSDKVIILPGEGKFLPFTGKENYLGWIRYGIMVGEGLNSYEIASLDFKGLTFSLNPNSLARDQVPEVEITIRNECGHDYAGAITGKLYDRQGNILSVLSGLDINVKNKASVKHKVRLHDKNLPIGKYRLEFEGLTEKGKAEHLETITLMVYRSTDWRAFFGAGASYASYDIDKTMTRLLADGVKIVRSGDTRLHRESECGVNLWNMAAFDISCAGLMNDAEWYAAQLGGYLLQQPAILAQVMTGEDLGNMDRQCYCQDCTASFRNYLQKKYGGIEALNSAWGSKYANFDMIEQVGSPIDIKSMAAKLKAEGSGAVPLDRPLTWLEKGGFEAALNRQGEAARVMEWYRCNDAESIEWRERIIKAFKRTNKGQTALCEQPCGASGRYHLLFEHGKILDIGGVDLYLPGGLPKDSSAPPQSFLNFDLNASVFQGKPLWVIELYIIQHENETKLLPEAQGWFLIGRGYSMPGYFTYDYSPWIGLPGEPISGVIDDKGLPYPTHESFVRFCKQSEEFNQHYNAISLRREEPQVAIFMGDDLSLAVQMESGRQPWFSAAIHAQEGTYWLSARNGYPLEFINDDLFERLAGKKVLIVPWTHVIKPQTINKILDFAHSGGMVVFDGPFALYDDLHRPYDILPGGETMKNLGVRFIEFSDVTNTLTVEKTSGLTMADKTQVATQGKIKGLELQNWEILGQDENYNPALICRNFGSGKIVWFLSSVGKTARAAHPAPEIVALWRRILELGGARNHYEVKPHGEPKTNTVCDVSARIRSDNEIFIFVVSFYDSTDGEVILHVPPGNYKAENALTGEAVPIKNIGNDILFDINLPPFGSKVIRLQCQAGAPFKGWAK